MTVANINPFNSNAPFTDASGRLTNEARLWLQRELVRRTQGPMTSEELADALAALQASEMVTQPARPDQLLPDVMQPSSSDGFLPDVVQSAVPTDLGEMTWQI